MTTILSWIVGLVLMFVVLGVVLGFAATALFATGGPSTDLVCEDSVSGAERSVGSIATTGDQLQARIEGLDAQLDAGRPGNVSFTESEATSRAMQFIVEHDIPVKQVIICFEDGNIVRGRAELDLGGLVMPLGVGGASAKAEAVGTLDLSGEHPVVELHDFSAGNMPGFAVDLAKGPLEDAINAGLAQVVDLDHTYTLTVAEESATLAGRSGR